MPSPNRSRGLAPLADGASRSLAGAVLFSILVFVPAGRAIQVSSQPIDADIQKLKQYEAAMPLLATARSHIEAEDYARAEELLAGLVGAVPEMSEAHLLLAKSRYAQGRFAAALTAMEKAEKSFDATAALMQKVRAARKADLAKEKSAQLAVLAALEAKQPPRGGVTDSGTLSKIGAAKQAIQLIDQEVVEIDAADVLTLPAGYPFFHGNVLLRLGRTSEAIEQYLAALAIDPAYRPAGNNLASVYYDAKRYEEARATIERLEAHGGNVNPELKKRVLAALGP